MENRDLAGAFFEMADLLEIQGGEPYRVRAFRRIGKVLESLPERAEALLGRNELAAVPGIGEGAIARIKEILRTGTCTDLLRLRAQIPSELRTLMPIDGLGPPTIRKLHQSLGIRSIEGLEAALASGALTGRGGLSLRSAERIARGLEHIRRPTVRISIAEALEQGEALVENLASEPAVLRAELTGSLRRRKEEIGDLDILVAAHDRRRVVARLASASAVREILSTSEGRASVRLTSGLQVDLRVLPPDNFGAGLHYFTGSQQHNIALRTRASRMGLKISDHGVFRKSDGRLLSPGALEAQIFAAVGLPPIPPELRENTGEIEAAALGRLPKLIELSDLRGDLHVRPPEGSEKLGGLFDAAAVLGLDYLAVVHPRSDFDRLQLARASERSGVEAFLALEVSIGPDGALSESLSALAEADWVIARLDGEETDAAQTTRRLIRAIESGGIDVLGQPTGRIFGLRSARSYDFEAVLKSARLADVALELNARPTYLDLDSIGCRRAKEMRVPIAIGSDARSPTELVFQRLGVEIGRRGWLEGRDVLNTGPPEAIRARRIHRRRKFLVPVVGSVNPPPMDGPAIQPPTPSSTGLEAALVARVLETELRERLERYLREGADPQLEAALRRLSDNPLQKAFELVVLAPQC